MNNPDHYPNLNLDSLTVFAGEWRELFPAIDRITLHNYIHRGSPSPAYQYAVVLEVSDPDNTEEFLFDLVFHDFFKRDGLLRAYREGQRVEPAYRDEWFFFPKTSKEDWPAFVLREPYWELYPGIVGRSSTAPPQQERPSRFMARRGEYWDIRYNNESGVVKDRTSVRYLTHFLENPNKALPAVVLVDLCSARHDRKPDADTQESARALVMEEDLFLDSADTEDLLDLKGKGALKAEINRLLASKSSGDVSARADAQARFDQVKQVLRGEYGVDIKLTADGHQVAAFVELRGAAQNRDKRLKKAQDLVRFHLRTGYAHLRKAGLKEMATHLEHAIRPAGAYDFNYLSDGEVWDVKR